MEKRDRSKKLITKEKPTLENNRIIKRFGSLFIMGDGVITLKISAGREKAYKIYDKLENILTKEGYYLLPQHRLNRTNSHGKSYLENPILKK